MYDFNRVKIVNVLKEFLEKIANKYIQDLMQYS